MRLAARRFLDDVKRAQRKRGAPFRFDDWHAVDACEFIEKLPHVEGEWATKTIRLHASHVFFIVNLFGFRNHDGTRRFTKALLAVARKNAKSTLAAAIMLYCMCCEKEVGAQVISAATTGQQARIVFNVAKRMVEKTPDLREAFQLEPFAHAIAAYQSGGSFKPINSKASTQDGLNPSHVELDEIHAHKAHDLLNVLESAAGARKNPLWLYTTTEGYESPGPWPELRAFTKQVLQGALRPEDVDHFFGIIFAVDDPEGEKGDPGYYPGDEDFDASKWIKANPLMDVNPLLEREILKIAAEAKQMPGKHAEFRIKRLNRQSAAATAWLNVPRWKLCAGPVDLKAMEGLPCWAALDGAFTTDIMAFRMAWRDPAGIVYTFGRRWVPEDAVRQRTERGTVPYAGWVAAGFITQTPGHTIDYAIVEEEVVSLCERFKPKIVAYDAWNLRDLVNRLKKRLPEREVDGEMVSIMEEFRQGPKSYNPAMKECERLYLEAKLRHGSDPVLNWCASNIVPRYDDNLNMAPDRKRSADKIDDAVAMLMAIGVMGAPAPEEQKPQLFFL